MAITAAVLKVDVTANTSDAEKGVASFGKKLDNTAKNMAVAGGALSLAVTAPLLGIAKAGIEFIDDFHDTFIAMIISPTPEATLHLILRADAQQHNTGAFVVITGLVYSL